MHFSIALFQNFLTTAVRCLETCDGAASQLTHQAAQNGEYPMAGLARYVPVGEAGLASHWLSETFQERSPRSPIA